MRANAAGPVMAIYLLLIRVQTMASLGSNAWLFLIINVTNLPFSRALGLVDGPSIRLDLLLAHFVLAGCGVGRGVIDRLGQHLFEQVTLVLATACAVLSLLT